MPFSLIWFDFNRFIHKQLIINHGERQSPVTPKLHVFNYIILATVSPMPRMEIEIKCMAVCPAAFGTQKKYEKTKWMAIAYWPYWKNWLRTPKWISSLIGTCANGVTNFVSVFLTPVIRSHLPPYAASVFELIHKHSIRIKLFESVWKINTKPNEYPFWCFLLAKFVF